MEKYGTYRVFKNLATNEIKRIPYTDEEALEKLAGKEAEWAELDYDPEEGKGKA